ncbi:hypothetical protein HY380_01390 [Candidatus Saccharibacteria bacterium]|nr:hypothetical protein [Candidatus Saccharibacteria bacterium]
MRTNQKGLGHLGLLLAVIVIAAVGFAGWWVFAKNQKDQASSSGQTTNTNNQSPTAPVTGDNYLSIEEWGIKLNMGEIADAAYVLKSGNMAYITTDYLLSNNKCQAYFAPYPAFSFLYRGIAEDTVMGSLGEPLTLKAAAAADAKAYPKIGSYYYQLVHGNGFDCDNTKAKALTAKLLNNKLSDLIYAE